MVLWLTILSYALFSFTFLLNMGKWKNAIKVFNIYTFIQGFFLVSSVAHARWSKQLNTLTLGRVAKASPPRRVLLWFQVNL